MSDRFYMVLTYGLNDFERGQIHQLLKSESDQWWHQFPDVWIVKGGKAESWRDLVRPIVPERRQSSVLVVRLEGSWSAYGTREQFDWLIEMLPADVSWTESAPPLPAPAGGRARHEKALDNPDSS